MGNRVIKTFSVISEMFPKDIENDTFKY